MAALAVIAVLVYAFFTTGLSIMLLWNWFVVPLGVPSIGFWHAIGIAALIGLFVPSNYTDTEETGKYTAIIVRPLAALLMGWLIHSLI